MGSGGIALRILNFDTR